MPRIHAATVAEHHALQRRALLDAARALLAETAQKPSMGAVGRRAGLARTSVYQYFASAEELLAALVAEIFPDWADQVLSRVHAASGPGERVWAYVEANLDLFASSERAVARALTEVVEPHVLRGPMEEFHRRLQIPLRQALTDFGEPEPEAMAEHIDSLILQASRGLADGEPHVAGRDTALARLRRLLGGYLRLDESSARSREGRGLAAFYRRYNACCNAHRFDDLAEFVAPDVAIDGTERGLEEYAGELRTVIRAFPDYRWEPRRLVVDVPWIAAHLTGTGTHRGEFRGVEPTGRSVAVPEFAVYRVDAGRIAEVWGSAFHVHLLEQLR